MNYGTHCYIIVNPDRSLTERLKKAIEKSPSRPKYISQIVQLTDLVETRAFVSIERKIHCAFIDIRRFNTRDVLQTIDWIRQVRPWTAIALYLSDTEWKQIELNQKWSMRFQHYWRVNSDATHKTQTQMLDSVLKHSEKYYRFNRLDNRQLYHWKQFECNVAEEFMACGFIPEVQKKVHGFTLDILAVRSDVLEPRGLRVAVECKYKKSNKVGPGEISQFCLVYPLLRQGGLVNSGLVVTPHGFTKGARLVSGIAGTDLIVYDNLQQYIQSLPGVMENKAVR